MAQRKAILPAQVERSAADDEPPGIVAKGEPLGTLSPRTVKLSLFVLRRALDQAVKLEYVARNVAKLVEMPRVERKEIEPPTLTQVKDILTVIKAENLEAAFVLALALGLRRGEVLGLRWTDIALGFKTLLG